MTLEQAHGKARLPAHKNTVACARRNFLRLFPEGFYDKNYLSWERDYKWQAHLNWKEQLGKAPFRALLKEQAYDEIARRAVTIEGRTNLIFSFEKMALRDAVRPRDGALAFAEGLYRYAYGSGTPQRKFEAWSKVIAGLPRPGTRILTWPTVTVFGFISDPHFHFFLKPMVTRAAARHYGYDFRYSPKPNWATYASALEFAARVRRDIKDLRPRDMIDLQSFIWVLGSDEYD